MLIALNKTLAGDRDVDQNDVADIKQGLQRLDYYDPKEPHILDIPDIRMFNGLEAFQKDHGLKADRYARPGGETEMKLNEVLNQGIASKALKPALPILRLDNGLKATEPPTFEDGLLHKASGLEQGPKNATGAGARSPLENQNSDAVTPDRMDPDAWRRHVMRRRDGTKPKQELPKAGYSSERALDIAEWVGERYGKPTNTRLATNALEHYRAKSGDPLIHSAEEIRNSTVFRKAEEDNRAKILASLRRVDTSASHDVAKVISSLPDGSATRLGDIFVEGGVRFNKLKAKGEKDHAYAFGNSDLKGRARLYARRDGDKVLITGVIDQSVVDRYDFHPSAGRLGKIAYEAEQRGDAKAFTQKGGWRDRLEISGKLVNGRLELGNPKWTRSPEGQSGYGGGVAYP